MSDPFSHVMDSEHWHFILDWGFHQPVGTKFMVLVLLAALLILAIYIPLARAARTGKPPTGWVWNCFEVVLTYIRDEVAKPNIGAEHHDEHHEHGKHKAHGHSHAPATDDPLAPYRHPADKYVPFLWTVFLFILFCNLLGMIPFLGSPTASVSVTAALALVTFFYIQVCSILKLGLTGYLGIFLPGIEAPALMKVFLIPMIVVIEVGGVFIKSGVLAVRLFANLFAGHLVLAFIMAFILMAKNSSLFWPISLGSVAMVLGLSLLELFVAFLQAFVFTFLTSIFLGMQLNPEH